MFFKHYLGCFQKQINIAIRDVVDAITQWASNKELWRILLGIVGSLLALGVWAVLTITAAIIIHWLFPSFLMYLGYNWVAPAFGFPVLPFKVFAGAYLLGAITGIVLGKLRNILR